MARKCTCKICGKQLTVDIAYKVQQGKRNIYYCSEEEYTELAKKKEEQVKCFRNIAGILGVPVLSPILKKSINTLNEHYELIVIEKTFKEVEDTIRWFMKQKATSNEFANAKYILTVVQNNINRVHNKHREEQKKIESFFIKQSVETLNTESINLLEEDTRTDRSSRENVTDISAWLV